MTAYSEGTKPSIPNSFPERRCPFLRVLLIAAMALVAESPVSNAQQDTAPYQNPSLSVDARVTDLLGRMTLEEKARQLDM